MLVRVTPRTLNKISVILSEACIGQPASCRHLFLSALPDVIIIRDPEWTFVAHGLVFRQHTCASHYLLKGQTLHPVSWGRGCTAMSGTGKGSGDNQKQVREWKEQSTISILRLSSIIYKQMSHISKTVKKKKRSMTMSAVVCGITLTDPLVNSFGSLLQSDNASLQPQWLNMFREKYASLHPCASAFLLALAYVCPPFGCSVSESQAMSLVS